MTGVGVLVASVVAGALWEHRGPRTMLATDAALAALAAALFIVLLPRAREHLDRAHAAPA